MASVTRFVDLLACLNFIAWKYPPYLCILLMYALISEGSGWFVEHFLIIDRESPSRIICCKQISNPIFTTSKIVRASATKVVGISSCTVDLVAKTCSLKSRTTISKPDLKEILSKVTSKLILTHSPIGGSHFCQSKPLVHFYLTKLSISFR